MLLALLVGAAAAAFGVGVGAGVASGRDKQLPPPAA